MAKTDFYDRKGELRLLRDKYSNLSTGEMLVIYGRRRVGKTELVKQFLEIVQENSLYFYVDLIEKKGILGSISSAILEQLKETVIFGGFDDFFKYIEKKSENGKFVIIIDEFQRFLDIAPEFITMLQNYWDSKLKHKQLLIILVGSSIGMMQKITSSKAGALYGRVTKIKVSPFNYHDFREMFKELSEEEKIMLFSVFGGTPFYLEKVKKISGNIHGVIEELMLKKGAELYEEPKNLLEYENVRVHSKYNAILSSIAAGKEILKEIQDFTGIESNIMPAYIDKLDNLLDLVKRNDPLLGKERLGRYAIKDNFFRFWYKFVFSNQTALNLGNIKAVSSLIKENLNAYVGLIFEDIVKELLILYLNKRIKGNEINFENIGSWWNRSGDEVDIVAYNNKTKKIIVGEVKWRSNQVDSDIIEEILRKSRLINFKGEYQLLLVSKSGFTKECIRRMDELNVIYLTLNDISKLYDDADK